MKKTATIDIDTLVSHQGEYIGRVNEIRMNIPNGRRYAFVQPVDPECAERRLPVDELSVYPGAQ